MGVMKMNYTGILEKKKKFKITEGIRR